MAESTGTGASQPKVAEAIVEAAKKAFEPASSPQNRETQLREYDDVIARIPTWSLMSVLNTLIKPNILPPWLREPLLQTLASLPLRPDGVRATLEFIFSVHPSSNAAAAESGRPQTGGAGITHDAVAVATRLLSSIPASSTPDAWFGGISGQVFDLLDGNAGQDLAKAVAQIVGFGILGKKQFGAPGAPGWAVFVQPLLESVNPSLRTKSEKSETGSESGNADIVDLRLTQVLVPAQSRVLKPVIPQLWALSSWIDAPQPAERQFVGAARDLVRTYVKLFSKLDCLLPLVQNLLCRGAVGTQRPPWFYHLNAGGEIEAMLRRGQDPDVGAELDWNEIDQKANAFVEDMAAVCSDDEVAALFLHLLRRWIETAREPADVQIRVPRHGSDDESPIQGLIEVTLLQKLIERAPEKLVTRFDQLLDVVCQVLIADSRSPLGDDLIAVALSLLNLVITAASFQKSDVKPHELEVIETALDRIGSGDRPDVSSTARNLAMLLKYRDEVDAPDEARSVPSARQVEDRRTYNLAMSYVTGAGDNPPPVVSEGLNLLSGLIVAESPIVDVTAVTVLLCNLLKENEDFVNLRVIKLFTQLANKHPNTTVQELLDNYLDAQEKASTDTRLRFGEALLQVMERMGETFAGPVATKVCETLLSIAGRRGHRPKTMARQAREDRLRDMKKQKRSGGEREEAASDDDDDDDDDAITDRERENRDVLAQIVEGWESKRGSEDVRVRTSSLSLLGAALEINMAGIEPAVVSNAVDLCVLVLTLEPEPEHGILRRAAVSAVLSFTRALDEARQSGRRLGLGLTETSRSDLRSSLAYVADTDNDGLVRQHARDAVESLEAGHARALLHRPGPGPARLAGLRVSAPADGTEQRRPRIEEVD
ncbi:hypothetical protein CDD83_1194 [Cordyceps sp. RAO-2017]|nr:hypothetical protein CDD83_1194 [Cordyceps sp. RAO-2017]